MNTRTATLALALALAAALPAGASNSVDTGALATPANRIVGTWIVSGSVSGANCTPASPAPAINPRAYLVFHAGGTITELPRLLSSTSPAPRSFGVGNWYYDRNSDTYYATFRFDWFAAGILQGYSVVDRAVQLDADGNAMAGPAVAVRYYDNGNVVAVQCGTATAVRF